MHKNTIHFTDMKTMTRFNFTVQIKVQRTTPCWCDAFSSGGGVGLSKGLLVAAGRVRTPPPTYLNNTT